MSRSSWRRIVVDEVEFEWLVPGNRIDVGDRHIRARARGARGPVLLIDPYAWSFEIRPKTIADTIRYALARGWNPALRGSPTLIVGMTESGELCLLPEGVRFGHELPRKPT